MLTENNRPLGDKVSCCNRIQADQQARANSFDIYLVHNQKHEFQPFQENNVCAWILSETIKGNSNGILRKMKLWST